MDPFDDLNREIEEPNSPVAVPLYAPWLMNGFYTLVFPCGTHKTFRVRMEKGKLAGKRTLAMMTGPSVECGEFLSFAFVAENGFAIWKKQKTEKLKQYAGLIWDLARGEKIEDYELLIAKRCLMCNRTLTTPESNESGVGPTCKKRFNQLTKGM